MVQSKTNSGLLTPKRQARIDGILDVALELLANNGLEGMSMHRVAGALDLTVGALYRYFDNKGAMIAALERRVFREYGDELKRVVLDPPTPDTGEGEAVDLLVPIARLSLAYGALSFSKPAHMQLINEVLANPAHLLSPDEAHHVIATMFEVFLPFESLFQRAADGGALSAGEANMRLLLFWNAARGVLQLYKLSAVDASRFDNEALYYETNRALLVGWGADPDALSKAWAIAARGME